MIPCSDCKRHIRETDASCPFCGRAQAVTSLPWVARVGAALIVTATLGMSACTNEPPSGDEAETSTIADTETDSETTNTTQEEESTNEVDDGGASFYAGPEDDTTTGAPPDCDPFAQDCPEGEKCVPYAGSSPSLDSNKCVPVLGSQGEGEPCTYAGVFESTDDCDETSFCFIFNTEGEGLCQSFCTGTVDAPVCGQGQTCVIDGQGSINLCIDTCDPLAPACPEPLGCTWISPDFLCTSHEETDLLGESCEEIANCGPGLTCVDSEALPECASTACCAEFCALDDPEAVCALEGTQCEPFYSPGQAPEGLENVGICIAPPP